MGEENPADLSPWSAGSSALRTGLLKVALVMRSSIWHDLSPMEGTGTIGGVAIAWGVGTDVGLTRAVNEDAAVAQPPVFVVADGMGGHDAGDVASRLAAGRFQELAGVGALPAEVVEAAVRDANRLVYEAGGSVDDDRSMGTTLVGMALVQNGPSVSWMLFNIGDSRVYRFIDGTLELLSVDHSYVQELVDSGELSPAAARTHPHRNVVTRALGVDPSVQPDLWLRLPVAGERYLLCSDGLSSELDDVAIEAIMCGETPAGVVGGLVAGALAAGGHDNVTVMVVDVVAVDGLTAADVVDRSVDEATGEHRVASPDTAPHITVMASAAADADERDELSNVAVAAVVTTVPTTAPESDDAEPSGDSSGELIDGLPPWQASDPGSPDDDNPTDSVVTEEAAT